MLINYYFTTLFAVNKSLYFIEICYAFIAHQNMLTIAEGNTMLATAEGNTPA